LTRKWYDVSASFPYFIPMPLPLIETMGAEIIQRRGAGDRKSLFDIAITPDPINYYDPGERPTRKPAAIEVITPQQGANPTQPG